MHRLAPATPRPPCDATRFPNPTHPFHHTHTQASPASPAAAAVLQKLTAAGPGVLQLYRSPGLSASKAATLLKQAQAKTLPEVTEMDTELCYNISLSQPLTAAEAETLAW